MIFFALAGFCCPGISKITVFSQFYICFVFDFAWFSVMFNDNLIALISFGFLWIRGLLLKRFLYFYWFLVNLFGNGFLWDYLDVFAFLKLFKHFLYVFFLHVALFFYMLFYFFYMLFFFFYMFSYRLRKEIGKAVIFFTRTARRDGPPAKIHVPASVGPKKKIICFRTGSDEAVGARSTGIC